MKFSIETYGGREYCGELVDTRVTEDCVPEGKHAYALRHGDDMGIPRTVEERVVVNYFGTFITDKKLPLRKGRLRIKDYSYGS